MTGPDFPALYQSADASAATAQNQYHFILGANLLLLVFAALLSVINYPSPKFAEFQAMVLLASLGATIYLATKKPQKTWYSSRALAESVKTVTWRYIMCAEPFNVADQDAKRRFIDTLKKLLTTNQYAGSHHVENMATVQISDEMLRVRSMPLSRRRQWYLDFRVDDQQSWYANNARAIKRKSIGWFSFLMFVNALAIIAAFMRIEYPKAENWPTDVFVAAAASILGWIQTVRYDELAASYSLTAHEISILLAGCPPAGNESAFSDFVGDAENAFSREHTQWQARRDVE